MRNRPSSTKPVPFHGWRLAAIGSIMNGLLAGFYGRGFIVYFLALSRDLNLNYTYTSLVFGLAALEGGVQSPITGVFIDRFGPRIMMVVGVLLTGIGFILLPLANSFTVFLLIFVGIISLGANSGFHNCSAAIVTRWFVRHRGTAFGVISTGIAIGGTLLTPIVAFMVMTYGWKLASVMSGIVILIVGLPLASMVRNSPEEIGQTPDGDLGSIKVNPSQISSVDFKVREATRTWSYWLLAFGVTLRISASLGVMVHMIPLMVWKGMGESAGVIVITSVSAAAIATRFLMGWLGDRWEKRKLVAGAMLVGAASLMFLLYSPGKLPLMIAFGLVLSITDGAAGVTWAMIGDYFGRTSYATLRGGVNAMVSIGALASPVYAGKIFDVTGSYYWVLITCSAIYVLAAVIFLILRIPQRKSRSQNSSFHGVRL